MSKTRLIPSWAGAILSRALIIYAPRVLELINPEPLKKATEALLNDAAGLITAISDKNPNNAAQVEAIARGFIREDAVPLAIETINDKVAGIQSERLRNGLTILAKPVGDALVLLTDEDPNNAEQAEAVLDELILNEQAQEFILGDLVAPTLERVINEPVLLAFVLETISTGLKEGAEELADIEVFNRQKVIDQLDARVATLKQA